MYGKASGATSVSFGVVGSTSETANLSAGVYGFNTTDGGVAGRFEATLTGTGVHSTASTGIGVYGNSTSNIGISALSTSGIALLSSSTSGIALASSVIPTSTNTVVPVARFARGVDSGVGADGVGLSIDLQNETSSLDQTSNQIISKFTTANNATRTSQFIITGVTSAATQDWLILGQSGYVKFRPMTVTEAGAIATAEGLMVFVSNTDGTFTSIGLWIYQNGAWKAL